jgi:hypothetical protein
MVPMLKLPICTWIRNAAAVLSGQHGSVQEQADESGCSRQTVYDHARKVQERLAEREQQLQAVHAEVAQLRHELADCRQGLRESGRVGPEAVERFAVTAQAMGVSLRQAEELLAALLPAELVPDHTTMGRWTQAAGRRAGEVLASLDPLCAPAVETLCADEIFFGG